MSSATFKFIANCLTSYLKSHPDFARLPLTVEKKVAITLYKLASCAEYRVVANQFGTHKSVVHKCVYQVCKAIYKEFKEDFLSMPNEHEAIEITEGFEEMCGIPNILLAIDGTHVPILPPSESEGYRDFVNRKGWPSYNMIALVDNRYRFRYITCQHPGSAHDSGVLKDSVLYRHRSKLLPNLFKKVNGVEVPLVVIGNPAYPLLPWLLKGYKGTLTPQEESFNAYMNQGRVVVEIAFGRLKGRFRYLLKRIDIDYKFLPKVVSACVILHNIIEMRKDSFMQSLLKAVQSAEFQFPQPSKCVLREYDSIDGGNVREILKNYMTRFPLKRTRLN